jgi:hypothetical protein
MSEITAATIAMNAIIDDVHHRQSRAEETLITIIAAPRPRLPRIAAAACRP